MMLNVTMFVIGSLVFLYLQMANSLRSSSNGLTNDWKGVKLYLKSQASALVLRAFLSAVCYPALIQKGTDTIGPVLKAAGWEIYAWGFSALAGFGASGMLYQVTGLIGFMRGKEMHEVSPPTEETNNDQPSASGSTGTTAPH